MLFIQMFKGKKLSHFNIGVTGVTNSFKVSAYDDSG